MHQCKTKTPWLACSLGVYYSMSFNNVLAPNLLQFLIHYGEVFRVAGRLFVTYRGPFTWLTDASERLAR